MLKIHLFVLVTLVMSLSACKRNDDTQTPELKCPATEAPLKNNVYFLPSGFTPNGDHLNDALRLITNDSASFVSMSLQIKDAFGQVLTTLSRPVNGLVNSYPTVTNPTQAWNGINAATGKTYPAGKYGVDLTVTLKRNALPDTSINEHTCVILFSTDSTGCNTIIGDYKTYVMEDQLSIGPGFVYTSFSTFERFCP
ncbi:MAG: hypothetical protein ABI378_14170 [Chitinophagaceae bacterium]